MRDQMGRGLPRRDLLRGFARSDRRLGAARARGGAPLPSGLRPPTAGDADLDPLAHRRSGLRPPRQPAGVDSATPQPTPSVRASPSPSAQTTLRLATNHAAVEVPWFRKVLDDFTRDNPAYQVEQTNVTARYLEQVASWAGRRQAARTSSSPAPRTPPPWRTSGGSQSIDGLVTRDAQAIDLADFHASQVEELKLDGKWLLLPHDYSGQTPLQPSRRLLRPRDRRRGTTGPGPTSRRRPSRRRGRTSAATRWGFAWAVDAGALPGLWLGEAGTFRRDDGRGISVSTADHVRDHSVAGGPRARRRQLAEARQRRTRGASRRQARRRGRATPRPPRVPGRQHEDPRHGPSRRAP